MATLNAFLLEAFSRGSYSDVSLVSRLPDGAKDVIFSANTLLLSRSPVFRAMFNQEFIEGQQKQATIPVKASWMLDAVIKYLYSDHLHIDADTSPLELVDLLELLQRLDIPSGAQEIVVGALRVQLQTGTKASYCLFAYAKEVGLRNEILETISSEMIASAGFGRGDLVEITSRLLLGEHPELQDKSLSLTSCLQKVSFDFNLLQTEISGSDDNASPEAVLAEVAVLAQFMSEAAIKFPHAALVVDINDTFICRGHVTCTRQLPGGISCGQTRRCTEIHTHRNLSRSYQEAIQWVTSALCRKLNHFMQEYAVNSRPELEAQLQRDA